MSDLWKLLLGFLFIILGLVEIIYNHLMVHGVLGRTITGIILVTLGVLILLFKKEQMHYAFFIAAFLTSLKMFKGLRETGMKIEMFIIGDIIMVLILAVIGFIIYYKEKKHRWRPQRWFYKYNTLGFFYHHLPRSWYTLIKFSMLRLYVFSTSSGKKHAGNSPMSQWYFRQSQHTPFLLHGYVQLHVFLLSSILHSDKRFPPPTNNIFFIWLILWIHPQR